MVFVTSYFFHYYSTDTYLWQMLRFLMEPLRHFSRPNLQNELKILDYINVDSLHKHICLPKIMNEFRTTKIDFFPIQFYNFFMMNTCTKSIWVIFCSLEKLFFQNSESLFTKIVFSMMMIKISRNKVNWSWWNFQQVFER